MATNAKSIRGKLVPGGLLAVLGLLGLLALAPRAGATGSYTYTRPADFPPRTVVTNGAGQWQATFTDGATTVTLSGPSRIFSEPGLAATVTSQTWVRLLPSGAYTPAAGGPWLTATQEAWLTQELADNTPDILAISMQYIEGAPTAVTAGHQIAGDADYGPLTTPMPSGAVTRAEGSDFNDYLQIAWPYGTYTDNPEADQTLSLDCSGFVRMVYGYRNGFALTLTPVAGALPRRATQMFQSAPGVLVIPVSADAQGTPIPPPPATFTRLAPGDLVFFDADPLDGPDMDHVGIYLGLDSQNHYRFISSRKTANGPTMGDIGGRSTLEVIGNYSWPAKFRAARRP